MTVKDIRASEESAREDLFGGKGGETGKEIPNQTNISQPYKVFSKYV